MALSLSLFTFLFDFWGQQWGRGLRLERLEARIFRQMSFDFDFHEYSTWYAAIFAARWRRPRQLSSTITLRKKPADLSKSRFRPLNLWNLSPWGNDNTQNRVPHDHWWFISKIYWRFDEFSSYFTWFQTIFVGSKNRRPSTLEFCFF